MANVFLAIPQYKKMPVAEMDRIKDALDMEWWEPSFDGFHPMFDASVAGLFNTGKHKIRYCVIHGDGNLPRARAFHLGTWRQEWETENRCEYFMIVDDDLSFPPEAIDILIEDDKPIVGGIYTFKTTDPNYIGKACTRFFERQELHENGTFKVQWLNGGFILVKAEVLLHMIEEYSNLAFDVPKEGNMEAKETWALWTPMIYKEKTQRIFLGEDWAFCQRARQLGYEIWADLRVKLIHWNAENGFTIGL